MSKHTPGPWMVHQSKGFLPEVSSGNDLVARVRNGRDARLVAAAPDLLDFARWVEKYASDSDGLVFQRLLEKARAAIAKAEGRDE